MPFDDPAAILSILSAMLTPAILISACATLSISTSARLIRALERVRELTRLIETHVRGVDALSDERLKLLFYQLERVVRRVRLLQRALALLYVTLGSFVATSIAIGLVQLTNTEYTWLPLGLAMLGAALFLLTCWLLVLETRIALATVRAEMDFALRVGAEFVPEDLRGRLRGRMSKRR
ncbi:MAG: DUF2721 domain-containing protein [Anaerolinea sp.]|nr:DUF2721 domain-containing protein [Anaerolinea sp.]